MRMTEYHEQSKGYWEEVRPVVIYFAGEKFVVEYTQHINPLMSPVVAMVHAYLGNLHLSRDDN